MNVHQRRAERRDTRRQILEVLSEVISHSSVIEVKTPSGFVNTPNLTEGVRYLQKRDEERELEDLRVENAKLAFENAGLREDLNRERGSRNTGGLSGVGSDFRSRPEMAKPILP